MRFFLVVLAALALFVSACSPAAPADPGQVDSAVSTLYAAATATAAAAATSTPVPTDPPSPTPVAPVISPANLDRLSIHRWFGQSDTPRTVAFSPDDALLVTAGGNAEDFDIRVWEVETGGLILTLGGHTGIVWNVAISPDGSLLASGSDDQTVKIWDLQTGALLHSLDFPYAAVSVRFSPDGQRLAIGGGTGFSDAVILIYSVDTWQNPLQLSEYWNIPDIEYSPNGQVIVAGGTSRNVAIWSASSGVQQSLLNHPGQVSSISISPDGSTIATGLCQESDTDLQCTLGAVWLWDLDSGTINTKLSDLSEWVTAVAYSPDGALLYAAARGGNLIVYDTANYPSMAFKVPDGVDALALSADGRLLATVGNGGINLWQVAP